MIFDPDFDEPDIHVGRLSMSQKDDIVIGRAHVLGLRERSTNFTCWALPGGGITTSYEVAENAAKAINQIISENAQGVRMSLWRQQ